MADLRIDDRRRSGSRGGGGTEQHAARNLSSLVGAPHTRPIRLARILPHAVGGAAAIGDHLRPFLVCGDPRDPGIAQ